MSQAIWILQYDLKSGSEHQYLDWFHNIHIPEKLARPGYLWATHYRGQIGALDHSENKRSYLALFGGVSTRTFLDPPLLKTIDMNPFTDVLYLALYPASVVMGQLKNDRPRW